MMSKEKRREYYKKRYLANREKELERSRKYRLEHIEQIRNRQREYMRKYRERKKSDTEWVNKESERKRKYRKETKGREWQLAHKEYYQALARERWESERQKCAADAAYYAEVRGKRRLYDLFYRRKKGVTKQYYPRFHKRIPDWAYMGEKITDYGSKFLIENQTAEQRAFVRELYRGRNPR